MWLLLHQKHPLTQPSQSRRGKSKTGKWERRKREREIITMTCENSLRLYYVYLICFDPLGFEIMFA